MNRNTFGFEIEIENTFGHTLEPLEDMGYVVTTDGSLRNMGREIVSPAFIGIPKLKLEYLKTLKFLKGKGNFSYRCGIHIHVGTFKLKDLIGLIEAYLPYERELFELFPNRKGSNFCVPVMDTDDTIYQIGKLFTYNTEQSATDLCNCWGKYSAMNITPMLTQGTIEFRVASGSFNHEKVFKMIDLIEAILDTFKGKVPKIKPKEDNMLEANEYLNMCFKYFNEDYLKISHGFAKKARKLLLNEEQDDNLNEALIDEILNKYLED